MRQAIFFALLGYLSGSVLFVRLAARLFGRPELWRKSEDENPGAANAFLYGGFFCGLFAVSGDLLKGILPVWLYCARGGLAQPPLLTALVLAAPVAGHIFPLYFRFRGGKGIAVTFGVLLGLLPVWEPVIRFALVFLFFSLVLRIDPHFYRTGATYLATALLLCLPRRVPGVTLGYWFITGLVLLRLHMSREARPKLEVKLLWMR